MQLAPPQCVKQRGQKENRDVARWFQAQSYENVSTHRTIYGSQWMQALNAQETPLTQLADIKLQDQTLMLCSIGYRKWFSSEWRTVLAINSKEAIEKILDECRTIAVVGLSSNPARASNGVASYMRRNGYRVIPVNPNETEVFGVTS